MPRTIQGIKIFVGSPGGLDSLRKEFRQIIDQFNRLEALPLDVHFEAVGWEDTLPTSLRRGQAEINEQVRGCDYTLFLLRDRWGSPTDKSGVALAYSSGTEEEYAVAGECIAATSMKDRSVFFLPVSDAQLKDPGSQLKSVLAFKQRLVDEKNCLFQHLDDDAEFADFLRGLLGKWRRAHEPRGAARDLSGEQMGARDIGLGFISSVALTSSALSIPDPAFDPVATAMKKSAQDEDFAAVLTLAPLARQMATRPADIVWAMFANGAALGELGRSSDEITQYDEVIAHFGAATELVLREGVAKAMVNKGIRLGHLGRSAEAITQYDKVIARFGAATEPVLRVQVAKAMVNKGISVSRLDRLEEEAITQYDAVIAHFDAVSEPTLREHVAKAMVNKGVILHRLGRGSEAISQYDEVIARFDAVDELTLRELVATAMVNKGITLGRLGHRWHCEDAITQFDEMIVRFGGASEPALRERVAKAMVNKSMTLGALGRSDEQIAQYDEVIARFGATNAPGLREIVAAAMLYKGFTLGQLDRSEDAIAQYDELIARYGAASEPLLRERVATAMFNKGITLGQLDRSEDEIAQYEELIARYGAASEPALREQVARARRMAERSNEQKNQKSKPRKRESNA